MAYPASVNVAVTPAGGVNWPNFLAWVNNEVSTPALFDKDSVAFGRIQELANELDALLQQAAAGSVV